ncbi:MAG: hypothetical protein PHD82_14150 [Candidatus Riflebacteria bacterium]|nr:hypothetical protein [Candidatus Riflebacteria bacterium]
MKMPVLPRKPLKKAPDNDRGAVSLRAPRSNLGLLLAIFLFWFCSAAEAQRMSYSPEAADLYQNAMGALRMRRLNLARQQLKDVIEKFPDDIHATIARRQLAAIMRDQKEYEQAIELLNEMITSEQSEDNIRMAREELLNILYELQRFRQGIELIEEWRKAQPNDIQLARNLAKFYLQAGRKDEAWLLLEKLVETGTAPEAFNELLDLAVRSAEVEKLLQTLESRRSRYRSNVFAEYASDCYLALGRKDKAIDVIMEVSDLPNHLKLLRKLADLQIETGEFEKAVGTLELVLRILPDDWGTLRKMGHCKFVQGKKKEAVDTWRLPLNRPYMPAREFFTEFTSVLIEHQLYDEALKAFEEARTLLQNVTLFSEEKATVLDAIGKRQEALEEYLHVLVAGIYKPEIFEKLYDARVAGFNFETRLLQLRSEGHNPAIMQALLEFYFRRADLNDIEKIDAIIGDSAGGFDYAFYDRLKQEALLIPTEFHFDVAEKVMKSRSESSLELMLADLLLRMAPHDESWQQRAYAAAAAISQKPGVADAEIKATLLLDLARFALEQRHDLTEAHGFADGILQSDLLRAVPVQATFAALLKARLLILEEKFAAAESLLTELGKKLQNPDFEALDMGIAVRQDHISLLQLESARLAMHQGDYQKALSELKKIVEETSEGDYVNDALEMALYITRRSIGDFDLLKRSLKAERLKLSGRHTEAAAELTEAIKKNASATALISEMQADLLLLRQRNSSDTVELIKDIESYAKENPENYKTADLLEVRLRMLLKQPAPAAEIRESLQSFVESFPSDLRSGRYRKILAVMQSGSEKEGKK